MTTTENTSSAEPQAGSTANSLQPQAGARITPPEPQAGEGQENISLEEAKKLRSEASNLRKRLKTYEDSEKETAEAKRLAEEAQLSEIERTKKQFSDLQSEYDTFKKQMQDRIVRYEIEAQASKLGIIDPEAASALLNRSTLEYGEDGTPNNAEKLLKDLIKNKPYLAPKPVDPPKEEQPAPPAQTANQQRPPMTPAMNPGRSAISTPNTAPQGPYKPPSWNDVYQK
jgi:hypothetical protein